MSKMKLIKQARVVGKLEGIQNLLRFIESELALCRDQVDNEQAERALKALVLNVYDISQRVQSAKNWAVSALVATEIQEVTKT